MSNNVEKGVFQPNFITFTNTDIVDRDPIAGDIFKGNQNNGFTYVTFADGSGGVEKQLKHWKGNKTGRIYRAEILAAHEYLAALVGKAMNAPIRDCAFTSTDAQTIVMPFISGKSGAETGEDNIPNNAQGLALRLFDYLTANSDRRPKNLMFADNGNIVGIDHALCNFKARNPKPDLISDLWNGGVTLESLLILKPKLLALQPVFQQFGMGDGFDNLIGNLDRISDAFRKVEAVVVAKAAFEAQTPPQGVQEAAKKALEWMKEGKAGRNFTSVGRKRASDLANGHPVSLDTLKRMKAYFDRHGVDKDSPHWNEPSPGKVAWYAWGGDAGYSWAKTMVARAEKAAEGVSKSFGDAAPHDNDKGHAKLQEADDAATEAMNLRRREKWESAYYKHLEAARLYNSAASMYPNDDDGHILSARGKAEAQKHLADEAKFQGDTGERHSPAEMDDTNPPTNVVKADDYSDVISSRKGEPTNQKLYDKVVRAAKRKFDVYPSAVANGWVVQEYKRRGGTYRKAVEKGDFFGHPFRGNQYQSEYSEGHVDQAVKYEHKGERLSARDKHDEAQGWFKAAAKHYHIAAAYERGNDEVHRVLQDRAELAEKRSRIAASLSGQASRASYLRAKDKEKWMTEHEAAAKKLNERLATIKSYDGNTDISKGDTPGHPFRGNQYASGIVSKLDNGESPSIMSVELPDVMTGIHDLGQRPQGYNITNLQVDGTKPFQTTETDRLREHMPQILPSQRPEFLADLLREHGITSSSEKVDPSTLKPSQNEIDGWKTGGVFKEFAETGIPDKRAPLVSKDNYIIDGHHYWSAALTMRAQNPNYKLPIRRLNCDIDTALHLANEWHEKAGNQRVGLGDVKKSGVGGESGDKPGHEFHGNQWTNVGKNGLPVSEDKKSPTAQITSADWKLLDKIVSERWKEKLNKWGIPEGRVPGPGYNLRIPEAKLNSMLKMLHGSWNDGDWAANELKNTYGVDDESDLTPKQLKQFYKDGEQIEKIIFAARLSGIKDKDWPQGHAPAYPYYRPFQDRATPLTSRDAQLAREVLQNEMHNRVPAARTTMKGLLGAIQDDAFVSGLDKGRTGLSVVGSKQKYLDARERGEEEVWGPQYEKQSYEYLKENPDESPYKAVRSNPFIGYMAERSEFLDKSNPKDVEKAIQALSPYQGRYIGKWGTKWDDQKKEKAAFIADVLKNPQNYVATYVKEKHPDDDKGASWTTRTFIYKISDEIASEKESPSPDTASEDKRGGVDEHGYKSYNTYNRTVRFYPLANKDGSLNKDVLFGLNQTNSEGIGRYGDIQVQFKDSTLKNATITPGDSIDWRRDPLPAQLAKDGDPRLSMADWATTDIRTVYDKGDKTIDPKEVRLALGEYIETQWWKNPTSADISKVVFSGKPPSPQVKALLDEKKIPYQVQGSEKPLASYALKPSEFVSKYGKSNV